MTRRKYSTSEAKMVKTMAEKRNEENLNYIERIKSFVTALKNPERPDNFEILHNSLNIVLKRCLFECGIDELSDKYSLDFVDIIGDKVYMEFVHSEVEDISIYTLPVSIFETPHVILNLISSIINDQIRDLNEELVIAQGAVASIEHKIFLLKHKLQTETRKPENFRPMD